MCSSHLVRDILPDASFTNFNTSLRNSMLTHPEDWNSAVLVLRYWISEETIPSYAWALIFWVFFSAMTTLGVRVYGEIEYIFGMFKFISLAVLFFLSILANVGAFGNGYVGFRYWRAPDGTSLNRWIRLFLIINRPDNTWDQRIWTGFRSCSSILCGNGNRVISSS